MRINKPYLFLVNISGSMELSSQRKHNESISTRYVLLGLNCLSPPPPTRPAFALREGTHNTKWLRKFVRNYALF